MRKFDKILKSTMLTERDEATIYVAIDFLGTYYTWEKTSTMSDCQIFCIIFIMVISNYFMINQ
jgi:hypothetical protein